MGKHKILVLLLCGFIAFIGGISLRMHNEWHPTQKGMLDLLMKDSQKKEEDTYYQLIKNQGRFYILVIGIDNVENSKRSDTVLLVSIDIDDKNIRVVSLPRDLRVMIPGHGTQKLNHAFAYGGQELLKATVEQYLSIPIIYYVIVDFDNFPQFVDSLGGVDLEVDKKMKYHDKAGNLDINIMPGLQHMDGKTSMHYVRFRHDALGDIGRIRRQQKFIKNVIEKIYTPTSLIQIPSLIRSSVQLFKTDMPPSYAIGLANFIHNEIPRENMFFTMCPGVPEMIKRVSYWIGDTEAVNIFLTSSLEQLHTGNLVKRDSNGNETKIPYSVAKTPTLADGSTAGGENDANLQFDEKLLTNLVQGVCADIAVLNGDGRGGICKEVAEKLQQLGVDVAETGNAKHFDYNFSNVIYPVNASASAVKTAKILGSFFGIANNLVRASGQAHCVSIVLGHDYKTTILSKLNVYLSHRKR